MWSAGVLLVAALVGILNYFGMKYYQRLDWTSTRLYSLSEKTEGVLESLDQPLEVTLFLQPGSSLYDPAKELLERYAAKSKQVSLRVVDPERNLVEAQRLVDRYQIQSLNVVVIDDGTDRRVIEESQLADYDYSGLQFGQSPTLSAFKGEEAFTGAILELVERRKPKVVWLTGHGEAPLEELGPEGASKLRDLLGQENLTIEPWGSLGQTEVPPGTDLVVIAGPRIAFLPPELELFDRYLDGGGRMLVLLDPELAPGGGLVSTRLESWLGERGVRVGDDLVVDPSATVPFFGAETIFVRAVGSSPVVRALSQAGYPVILALARSVAVGEVPEGLVGQVLLETSADGWGERNLANLRGVEKDAGDLPGPVPVAVAIAPRPPEARELDQEELDEAGVEESAGDGAKAGTAPSWRLAVIGDSDFLRNGQLASVGNPTLASNAFNWLLERENLLGIGPKKPEQARLALTPGQLSAITWLSLLGLPALAVAAGVTLHFRRRR